MDREFSKWFESGKSVTMLDEEGKPYRFRRIAYIEVKGERYMLLSPCFSICEFKEDNSVALVFKAASKDDRNLWTIVTDLKERRMIFRRFYEERRKRGKNNA